MAAEPTLGDSGGIGRRVRAARERLGWTTEALAYHSGLSWSAIAQVESGRRTHLRPNTLAALSRPLGVSIDYLVAGIPPRPPMLQHSEFRYATDDEFQTTMGAVVAEGIERSEAIIAVTTSRNIALLREHLGEGARKVMFVEADVWYTTPIAALDAYRTFADAQLESGADWVRIVGEPVWAGRPEAEVRLWNRYESLLNLAFSAYPLSFFCPYDERTVAPDILAQARLTHPHAVTDAGIAARPDFADPARMALEP